MKMLFVNRVLLKELNTINAFKELCGSKDF